VVAAATFRGWAVGVRVNIVATTAAAGNNVLFQLARPGNTMTGTTATRFRCRTTSPLPPRC